jgi:hypothetical protein
VGVGECPGLCVLRTESHARVTHCYRRLYCCTRNGYYNCIVHGWPARTAYGTGSGMNE